MSETHKNILFMIPSLYGGGAEKVCCILASALAERHHVTVGYLIEKDEEYPLHPDCERVLLPWGSCRRWNIPGRLLKWCRNIRGIRKIKKERSIDVTVSFLMALNLFNVLSRYHDRVITSERANPKKYLPEKFWITRFSYAHSDHVVFQSELVRHYYSGRILRHSSVIPNPVSVRCKAAAERKHRIVAMGRLTEQKNHRMLIQSFAEFRRSYPDYTLSIYGEGDLQEELQALISELDLQGSVILEGNHPDVHERIRDAEIFVLSSNFEGLSNALLECMTMGIACISTRCEGSTDVIRDGENGLLTEIGNGQELTEAMLRLAGDPAFRRSLEAQALKDAENFTIDRVTRRWEAVLLDKQD
ncbi:MAG: glycosyltransferase [Mogibacterium sp.]|nr:glycosyltransferase [Mogibacterium sp.]